MVNTNRLKGKIMEAGYSRKEFADKLGINENTLVNRLKGRSSFKLDEVGKMCDILNITSKDDVINIFFDKSVPNIRRKAQ